jgi:hypothetical protein
MIARKNVVPLTTRVCEGIKLAPPTASTPEHPPDAENCLSQLSKTMVFTPGDAEHALLLPPLATANELPGISDQALIAAEASSIMSVLGAPSGLTRNDTGCPESGSNHRIGALGFSSVN